MTKHLEECERVLTVGATVWRARYGGNIEQGKVRRITTGRYDNWNGGRFVEDAYGKHKMYYADFPSGDDYEGQGYEWRFFHRPEDAKKDAIKLLERANEEDTNQISKRIRRISELRAELAATEPKPAHPKGAES